MQPHAYVPFPCSNENMANNRLCPTTPTTFLLTPSLPYGSATPTIAVCIGDAAVYLNTWFFWPIYWVAQGIMFWALFVLGHDCGHGSFSDNPILNSVVGHILHSSILVPYHGWRIGHRTHHQNHGNVETDESWVPLPEKICNNLDFNARFLRFTIPSPYLHTHYICGIEVQTRKDLTSTLTATCSPPREETCDDFNRLLDCNGYSACLFIFYN